MSEEDLRKLYGWAQIAPDQPVVAGDTGTWRITYHTGLRGVDDGGVVKISWRDISDWAAPQFDDPAAANFASVSTTGSATLRPRFEKQRYIRPWRASVTIDVFDDSLSQGDTITLILGDTSGGASGSRAQTFCKEDFQFRVAVDWCGTWVYVEVPSPGFPIISGPPHRLVVLNPSRTVVGEPTWIGIKAEDRWGNPCAQYRGQVQLRAEGLVGIPPSLRFASGDNGVKRLEGITAPQSGIYQVQARDEANDLAALGNPLEAAAASPFKPFWGDLHGQSEETIGTNPVSAYFTFARDKALVDFAGHQGNDFQITDAIWQEIRQQANSHNQDGRFTAFVGYEWSGNTPVGGDRNIYFPTDDGPLRRSSHVLIPDKSDLGTDCPHVTDLHAAFSDQDVLMIPHVGGRYADLSFHAPNLEVLVEVYSAWGEFEWFLREALERGYKVGFTCGSDDHKGRPGAAHPGSGSFGVYGGLTCIWAKDLSRQSLWEALRARRCYGTTGQRILLDFSADGQPLGAEFEVGQQPPVLEARVLGTAPIERIDLFRGLERIYSYPETIQRDKKKVRIAWSGQRIRARNRLVRWDGQLTLDQGRIINAQGYAFDSPAEGLRDIDTQRVSWQSVTTGDADGVILELDAPDEALLHFDTQVVQQTISLAEIAAGPVKVSAGGIDMQVICEFLPQGCGQDIHFDFQEEHLPPGIHPYWLRVLQTDGAKAWASPIYAQQRST